MGWTLSLLVFAGVLGGMFVAARVLAWVAGLIAHLKDTAAIERRVSLAVPLLLHSGPWALAASLAGLYYASRHAEPAWFWALLGGFVAAIVLLTVVLAVGMRKRSPPPPLTPDRLLIIRRRFFWLVTLTFGGSQAAAVLYPLVDLLREDLATVLVITALCLCGGYAFAWFMWQYYGAKLLSREEMRRQVEHNAAMRDLVATDAQPTTQNYQR